MCPRSMSYPTPEAVRGCPARRHRVGRAVPPRPAVDPGIFSGRGLRRTRGEASGGARLVRGGGPVRHRDRRGYQEAGAGSTVPGSSGRRAADALSSHLLEPRRPEGRHPVERAGEVRAGRIEFRQPRRTGGRDPRRPLASGCRRPWIPTRRLVGSPVGLLYSRASGARGRTSRARQSARACHVETPPGLIGHALLGPRPMGADTAWSWRAGRIGAALASPLPSLDRLDLPMHTGT